MGTTYLSLSTCLSLPLSLPSLRELENASELFGRIHEIKIQSFRAHTYREAAERDDKKQKRLKADEQIVPEGGARRGVEDGRPR